MQKLIKDKKGRGFKGKVLNPRNTPTSIPDFQSYAYLLDTHVRECYHCVDLDLSVRGATEQAAKQWDQYVSRLGFLQTQLS